MLLTVVKLFHRTSSQTTLCALACWFSSLNTDSSAPSIYLKSGKSKRNLPKKGLAEWQQPHCSEFLRECQVPTAVIHEVRFVTTVSSMATMTH